VDFFQPKALAQRIQFALEQPERMRPIREQRELRRSKNST